MDRNTFYNNLKDYEYSHKYINKTDYLMHYGVVGQKWGVRRYQNPDGTLTEEGKQRYLNPDGSLTKQARKELKPDQQLKISQEFYKKQSEQGTGEYADNAIYDENKQKEKLNNAKQNKMYDNFFVETIQNAENLSDDDINREYEAYLKNPRKYAQEFMVDGNGKITNSLSRNNTSKSTNNKVENELKDDLEKQAKSAFGPKATPEEESKFWKALAKEYEKGNIKNPNSTKSENKEKQELTKEEKKELKKAKQEAWKTAAKKHGLRNLVTGPLLGTLSDWGMVNKAIKELGYTSAEKKNLTASDWNKINEKIADMRGFNKSKLDRT